MFGRTLLRTAALAALVLLTSGPAPCAAEDYVTFGGTWWNQSAPDAKYFEFTDRPRGGFLEAFALSGVLERNVWGLEGVRALQKDQFTGFEWANGARWRLDASYSEIPHTFSNVARTPWMQSAAGVFVLPDSLQRMNQENPGAYNSTMADLLANAGRTPLETRTHTSVARLRYRPAPGWKVEAKGTMRNRSGQKAYGAAFGFSDALEIVEPLDQRMVDADLRADLSRERFQVRGGVGISMFENNVSTLRWDNPRRITNTATASALGQLDLYPDNRAVRGNLAVGVQLPQRTQLSASFAASRIEQDDDWLPFTINPAIAQSSLDSLPGTNTDGKAMVLDGSVRLTTRAVRNLTGTLRVNFHDYDNQTPEHEFIGRARMDQAWVAEPASNHAFGNKQTTGGVNLDYAIGRWGSIGAMAELRKREHTHREVEKDDETVFGGRVRTNPVSNVSVHGSWKRGERELDDFIDADYQNDAGVFIEQPGLRRYDVANRTRDEAAVGLDVELTDWFSVGAGYTRLNDDFTESSYGLQSSEQQQVMVDGTLSLNERIDVTGGYSFIQGETEQKSNETNASPPPTPDAATDWMANLKDRNVYSFVNATWRAVPQKLHILVDYEFSRAIGEFRLTNTAATARNLPSTFYRRHLAQIEGRWMLMADTDIGLRYGFDQYDVTDFATEDIPLLNLAGTSATAIWLGDSAQDYRAHRVALVATHRF